MRCDNMLDIELQSTIERLNSYSEESRITKSTDPPSTSSENKCRSDGINVFISSSPAECQSQFKDLFTDGAIEFLSHLIIHFEKDIENLYNRRLRRRVQLQEGPEIPKFSDSAESLDGNWRVAPVDDRLKNRHLELGDVSPSDIDHLKAALKSPVQGIQVDFDDGHCPTWRNEIVGLHNVYSIVRGMIPGAVKISEAPRLMLRPRAWNMIEKNMSVNGRQIPGALLDFSLLVYHNGEKILEETGLGASFYLSKVECAEEAKLWNEIFRWSESRLELPRGCLKACVLIENIISVFAIDDILWELRERSLGLNCGIWDYAASIIAKFGTRDRRFLLPDRKKYVSIEKSFLKSYMTLVARICHKRGTFATGGMAANLLPAAATALNDDDHSKKDFDNIVNEVRRAKLKEIEMGLDGFLVYDLGLVRPMNDLWREYAEHKIILGAEGSSKLSEDPTYQREIHETDLLKLPKGGVTIAGLEHNIRVVILYIYHWLHGKGHFPLDGFIEDSATAEISRSQIWQWIRFGALIEDCAKPVTRRLIRSRASRLASSLQKQLTISLQSKQTIFIALHLFLDLVNRYEFPDFITTYLNEQCAFKNIQPRL